ncbi:MAG: hypothetical protein ACOH2V_00340 [Candidatus Saccharimonadaceae bacterium]
MERLTVEVNDLAAGYEAATAAGINDSKTINAFTAGSLPSEGTFDRVTVEASTNKEGDNTSHIRIHCGLESVSMGSVQISGFQKALPAIKADDALKSDKYPNKLFLIGERLNPEFAGDQVKMALLMKGRKFTTVPVSLLCSTPKFDTAKKLIPASDLAEAKASLKSKNAYRITLVKAEE